MVRPSTAEHSWTLASYPDRLLGFPSNPDAKIVDTGGGSEQDEPSLRTPNGHLHTLGRAIGDNWDIWTPAPRDNAGVVTLDRRI